MGHSHSYLNKKLMSRCEGFAVKKGAVFKTSNLQKTKLSPSKFSEYEGNTLCTLAIFTNLVHPYWIPVYCTAKMVHTVICQRNHKPSKDTKWTSDVQNLTSFPRRCVIIDSTTCYHFIWTKRLSQQQGLTEEVKSPDVKMIKIILDAVSDNFPPIFSHNRTKLIVQSSGWSNFYRHSDQNPIHGNANAFVVVFDQHSELNINGMLFSCKNKQVITTSYLCDGKQDCQDSSDEQQCLCNATMSQVHTCKQVFDSSGKVQCSDLYFSTKSRDCQMYRVSSQKTDKSITKHIHCTLQAATALSVWCEDKHRDSSSKVFCNSQGLLACNHESACFQVYDICIYRLDKVGFLYPCQFGSHIESCSNFLCNKMFKCPQAYCIPLSYVHNGKWDCPWGIDEGGIANHTGYKKCLNMYKCRMTNSCISLFDVCDEHIDCKYQDDEFYCDLMLGSCPFGCVCLLYASLCHQLHLNGTLSDSFIAYQHIQFSNCKIQCYSCFNSMKKVLSLKVVNCGLTEICSLVQNMEKVFDIDFSSNALCSLKNRCFFQCKLVQVITLSNNNISTIRKGSLETQEKLLMLNLSNNLLHHLEPNVFFHKHGFTILSLKKNVISEIDGGVFLTNGPAILETDNFALCCIVPSGSKCTISIPWHASCSGLLPVQSLFGAFIFVSIFIFCMNIVSITLQRVSFKKKLEKTGVYATTVVSNNVVDIIHSIPFLILWISHTSTRQMFWFQEKIWRSSFWCFCTHALLLFVNIISPGLLFLLAVSRLMVVKHPVDSKFKRTKYIRRTVGIMSSVCSAISVGLTCVPLGVIGNVSSVTCSPFISVTKSFVAVFVFTFCVFTLQFLSSIAILIAHVQLVLSVQKSQIALQQAVSKQKSNVSLFAQLIIITATNFVCWTPGNLVFIVSLFKDQSSIKMLLWVTIMITTCNSLLNPVVFSLTTARKLAKLN